MTDATMDSVPAAASTEPGERELRREYKLSLSAKVSIVFTGAFVIFLNLAKYGHEQGLWWWFPNIPSVTPEQWIHGTNIALFFIDGAAKAAIISFAATFILRIDIKKFVERVIEAQPLLTDPKEGARLRDLLRGEIRTLEGKLRDANDKIAEHEATIRRKQTTIDLIARFFSQFELFTKQVAQLREDISRS